MKFGLAATKKVLKQATRAALKSKVYYNKHRPLNTLDVLIIVMGRRKLFAGKAELVS